MAREAASKQRRDRRRYLAQRNVGHVPLRLPKKQAVGLQAIADKINAVNSRSATLGPEAFQAWTTIRNQIVEPLIPEVAGARQPGLTLLTGLDLPGPDGIRRPVVLEPSPKWAASTFNRLSRKSAVRLVIAGTDRPSVAARTELDRALADLWFYLFQGRGWERLKKCRVCARWFADSTRNRNKVYCPGRCSNRFWSRPRRKAAKLARIRAGRRRGGPRAKARLGVPRAKVGP